MWCEEFSTRLNVDFFYFYLESADPCMYTHDVVHRISIVLCKYIYSVKCMAYLISGYPFGSPWKTRARPSHAILWLFDLVTLFFIFLFPYCHLFRQNPPPANRKEKNEPICSTICILSLKKKIKRKIKKKIRGRIIKVLLFFKWRRLVYIFPRLIELSIFIKQTRLIISLKKWNKNKIKTIIMRIRRKMN